MGDVAADEPPFPPFGFQVWLPAPLTRATFRVMPPLVRLAIAQFKAQKGDYTANLERLGELFAQVDALEPRPHVLLLPETALTGYFVEGGVRDVAVTAGTLARDLDAVYRDAAR